MYVSTLVISYSDSQKIPSQQPLLLNKRARTVVGTRFATFQRRRRLFAENFLSSVNLFQQLHK